MTRPGRVHPHEKPHHPHWPLAVLLSAFVLCLGLQVGLLELAWANLHGTTAVLGLWPDSLDAALASPRLAAKALQELDRWIVQAPDSVQA